MTAEFTGAVNISGRARRPAILMAVGAALVLIVCWVVLFIGFLLSNQAKTDAYAATTVENSVLQQQACFDKMLDSQFCKLEVLAGYLGTQKNMLRDAAAIEAMYAIVNEGTSMRLTVADPEGNSIAEGGILGDISDRAYFCTAREGMRALAGPLKSGVSRNDCCIVLAVPIYEDGVRGNGVIGVLSGAYAPAIFGELLLFSPYYGEGTVALIEPDGDIITDDGGAPILHGAENVFTFLKQGRLQGAASIEQLRSDIASGVGGIYIFEEGSEQLYITQQWSGVNDWILLGVAPESAVFKDYAAMNSKMTRIAIAMVIAIILLVAGVIILLFRDRRRLLHEKKRVELLEERYRIVALDSNEFVFELNPLKRTIEVSEYFNKIFSFNASYEAFMRGKYIHPDDKERYAQYLSAARSGNKNFSIDLRYMTRDGSYIWCATYITVLTDRNGRLQRILGKIINIDDKKRETQSLQEMVQRDSMTGLYNKKATEDIICEALEQDPGSHCLFMIDIDDLKGINDTLGHVIGDEAIKKIAKVIRSSVRVTDIVGRVGGDEFIAFLPNIDGQRARIIAQTILRLIGEIPAGSDAHPRISCSIGAAHRACDMGFDELYRNADEALYLAKSAGKNQIVFYESAKAYAM